MKVFLGGTCNESTWRDQLIKMLDIDYFNPVVKDWTPACQQEEIKQRETCDLVLYCITPKMTGFYSVAEVVDDSNKRPEKTVFCVLEKDQEFCFDNHQVKSLKAIRTMVEKNGAKFFNCLYPLASYLNKHK